VFVKKTIADLMQTDHSLHELRFKRVVMTVAYFPLLLPLNYAMWRTQLTWSISRV